MKGDRKEKEMEKREGKERTWRETMEEEGR
jgi:hypothetical protein